MRALLRLFFVTLVITASAGLAWAQPPAGQDDFVPASTLPAAESLPAAPMVMTAYAFVWVALFVYVWFIWRQLQRVEHDLADLERRARER
jgi:CcmD family protein